MSSASLLSVSRSPASTEGTCAETEQTILSLASSRSMQLDGGERAHGDMVARGEGPCIRFPVAQRMAGTGDACEPVVIELEHADVRRRQWHRLDVDGEMAAPWRSASMVSSP